LDENLVVWVPDPAGEGSYPIVTYTWMLCRRSYDDRRLGAALKRVLNYAVTEGQKCSRDLGYVPLPDFVAAQVAKAIGEIRVRGEIQETGGAKAADADPRFYPAFPIAWRRSLQAL
jgi:phosphate transport system substrate-binding protein